MECSTTYMRLYFVSWQFIPFLWISNELRPWLSRGFHIWIEANSFTLLRPTRYICLFRIFVPVKRSIYFILRIKIKLKTNLLGHFVYKIDIIRQQEIFIWWSIYNLACIYSHKIKLCYVSTEVKKENCD